MTPLLLLIPLTASVGLAGQRVSGTKDQRVIEPLLLLPLPRWVVMLGKALAGYAISSVLLPAFGLPLLVGRFVPVGDGGQRVALPLLTVLAVVGIGIVLIGFLVALGVCVGSAAGTSSEMGSLLPFFSMPVYLLGITMNFLHLQSQLALLLMPVLGPTLVARDIVTGTGSAADAVIASIATVAGAAALLALASRFLHRERAVLRAST